MAQFHWDDSKFHQCLCKWRLPRRRHRHYNCLLHIAHHKILVWSQHLKGLENVGLVFTDRAVHLGGKFKVRMKICYCFSNNIVSVASIHPANSKASTSSNDVFLILPSTCQLVVMTKKLHRWAVQQSAVVQTYSAFWNSAIKFALVFSYFLFKSSIIDHRLLMTSGLIKQPMSSLNPSFSIWLTGKRSLIIWFYWCRTKKNIVNVWIFVCQIIKYHLGPLPSSVLGLWPGSRGKKPEKTMNRESVRFSRLTGNPKSGAI